MSDKVKHDWTIAVDKIFPHMEVTIDDSLTAWAGIRNSLPDKQGEIIYVMSQNSKLIQTYVARQQKLYWNIIDGEYINYIPHGSAVKALVRKGIIIPTISDKEWEIQIALGSIDTRIWKVNPVILKSLQDSWCLIRTIKEHLKTGGDFKCKN